MLRGNGDVGWEYAESKALEVNRAPGKLTFHLTGLRSARLRIVLRFKAGGMPISHVYARREPNEDDVVYSILLDRSRDDLVITPKSFIEPDEINRKKD
jgi:hypothetical protein